MPQEANLATKKKVRKKVTTAFTTLAATDVWFHIGLLYVRRKHMRNDNYGDLRQKDNQVQKEIQDNKERIHILEGLQKFLGVSEKVLAVISNAKDKDEARIQLTKKDEVFGFSLVQSEYLFAQGPKNLESINSQDVDAEIIQKKEIIDELKAIPSEMQKVLSTVPYIEDKLKSDWLLQISKYGPKPILLTYKASQNTLAQSPLYGAVLAKETLHHTDTSSDMKRIFNNELDTQLRSDWRTRSKFCPVFIQLWEAYPKVYEELKKRDGQPVYLRYQRGKLTIVVPGKEFVLKVKTIKD